MACSSAHCSLLFTLFIILFSTQSSATDIPPLLPEACSKSGPETELCNQVLESDPRVDSSIDFFDLCANIIDSGISNATAVHAHILDLLKDNKTTEQIKIKALKDCESGYNFTLMYLKSAVGELSRAKETVLNLYLQSVSYDLFISVDGIRKCEDAVLSSKIGDEIIVKGNEMAKIFRRAAIHVVDDILIKAVADGPRPA